MSPMSGAGPPRRAYWRSLEELAELPEIAARLEREMARSAGEMGAVERRRFLQVMAASLALGGLTGGLAGCGPEENPRQLLPYVEQPPGIVPGLARATAMIERRDEWAKSHGAGLRLLTGATTSPSLIAQIAVLRQQFPAMRWHQWEPLDRDEALAAAQAAFGRPLDLVCDLGMAEVIFAVESDLISAA